MIRKALHDDPENAAYLDSMGWVLFKRGKLKEALDNLQKAVEKLERPDPTILEHLGDVYLKLPGLIQGERYLDEGAAGRDRRQLPPTRPASRRSGKKLDSLDKLSPTPKPASSKNP